jgi:hypothetical protein
MINILLVCNPAALTYKNAGGSHSKEAASRLAVIC